MTLAPTINGEAVRETFRAWNAEWKSFDTELSESLAALEAYQRNLDDWQQQLARERDELRIAREQLETERSASDRSHAESSATTLTELHASREKITALTTLLLSRTEELRTLDNRRAEVQTELELSRARERELKAALEEHQRSIDDERSQWADELKQLREVLQGQLDAPVEQKPVAAAEQPAPPAPLTSPGKPLASDASPAPSRENPLLGSIAEQFGKLRQQRAVERQAGNRQR
jgi:chromosome segregation ATPase